jgi:hypothetical protein
MTTASGYHRFDSSLTGLLTIYSLGDNDPIYKNDLWFQCNGIPLMDSFDFPSGFNYTNPSTGLWRVDSGDWKVVKPGSGDGDGVLRTSDAGASISFYNNYPSPGCFFGTCVISYVDNDLPTNGSSSYERTLFSINNLDCKLLGHDLYAQYINKNNSNILEDPEDESTLVAALISRDTGAAIGVGLGYLSQGILLEYQQWNSERSFLTIRTISESHYFTNNVNSYKEPVQENFNFVIGDGFVHPSGYFTIKEIKYTKPAYNGQKYNPIFNDGSTYSIHNSYSDSKIYRPINYKIGPNYGLLDSGNNISAIEVTLGGFSDVTNPHPGLKGFFTHGDWTIVPTIMGNSTGQCIKFGEEEELSVRIDPVCSISGGVGAGGFYFNGTEGEMSSHTYSEIPGWLPCTGIYMNVNYIQSAVAFVLNSDGTVKNVTLPVSGDIVRVTLVSSGDCYYSHGVLLDSDTKEQLTSVDELLIGMVVVRPGRGGCTEEWVLDCYNPPAYPHKLVRKNCCNPVATGRCDDDLCNYGFPGSIAYYSYFGSYLGTPITDSIYAFPGLAAQVNGTHIVPFSGYSVGISSLLIASGQSDNQFCCIPNNSCVDQHIYLHVYLQNNVSSATANVNTGSISRNIDVILDATNTDLSFFDNSIFTNVSFFKTYSRTGPYLELTDSSRNSPVYFTFDGTSVSIPSFRYITPSKEVEFPAATIEIPSGVFGYNNIRFQIFGMVDKAEDDFGIIKGFYTSFYSEGGLMPPSSLVRLVSFEPDSYEALYEETGGYLECYPDPLVSDALYTSQYIDGYAHGTFRVGTPYTTLSNDKLSIYVSGLKYYDKNNIWHKNLPTWYDIPVNLATGIHKVYMNEDNEFTTGSTNSYNLSVDNSSFNTEDHIAICDLVINDRITNVSGLCITLQPYQDKLNYRFLSPIDAARFIVFSGCGIQDIYSTHTYSSNSNYPYNLLYESISGIPITVWTGSGNNDSVKYFNSSVWDISYNIRSTGTYFHCGYRKRLLNYDGSINNTYDYYDTNLVNDPASKSIIGFPIATCYLSNGNLNVIDDREQCSNIEIFGIQSGFPDWGNFNQVYKDTYQGGYSRYYEWNLLDISCIRNSGDMEFIVDYSKPRTVSANKRASPSYYDYWVENKKYTECDLPKKFTMPIQTGVYSIYYNNSGIMNLIFGENIPPSSLSMIKFEFVRERSSYPSLIYNNDAFYPYIGYSITNEYQPLDNSTFNNLQLRKKYNAAAVSPGVSPNRFFQYLQGTNPTCQVTIVQN